MGILIVLGSSALALTLPIALAIAGLVAVVVFSYTQTILHYPAGGGAYTVAKDNLGTVPSLLAAGALLTDYVLTVAVSVSAGIRAITSAFPQYYDERVMLALGAILILTWANLRGVRESGTLFAFPTYAFVGGVLAVIGMGLVRYQSILSQMTRVVTRGGFLYYWVQLFTMLILVLAANTGYQDFPRLSSFLARDRFMPRWMQNRGDRLVYSSGIVVLAILASVLVIVFGADEIRMLPLYALGVMVSFTLSQAGMVRLMGKVSTLSPGETLDTGETTIHYESGWRWKRTVNAIGAVTTFIVLIILVATKFVDGAWIVVLAIPLLMWLFQTIKEHYQHVAASLRTHDFSLDQLPAVADVVIVPIADVHRGTLLALRYAKRLSRNVRAVSIVTSQAERERLLRRWEQFQELTGDIALKVIEYDYRWLSSRVPGL